MDTVTVVDSTIANNFAGLAGGGIWTAEDLYALNTTIAYNVVDYAGDGGGVESTS